MITKDQIPQELIEEARHYANNNKISFRYEDPEKRIQILKLEIKEKTEEIERITKDREMTETQKQRMIAFLESIGEPIEYPKDDQ